MIQGGGARVANRRRSNVKTTLVLQSDKGSCVEEQLIGQPIAVGILKRHHRRAFSFEANRRT